MKFIKPLISSLALFVALCAASPAMAHSDDFLDTQKAPNGGQLRMAGPYHFELLVAKDSQQTKDNPVVVYVTGHAGEKISTAGASGTVTLLSGKSKTSVQLQADGDNRLKGMARYASSPNMKAVAAITLAGKPTAQARFTPLALPKPVQQVSHAGHKH